MSNASPPPGSSLRQEQAERLNELLSEKQRRAEEAASAAEAAGEPLDLSFYSDLKRIQKQLETHADAWPFLEPVSDVEVRQGTDACNTTLFASSLGPSFTVSCLMCRFSWSGQQAPGYSDVIKHPMDLSTIRALLDDKTYLAPEEYARDVLLMLENCRHFNKAGQFAELADKTEVQWRLPSLFFLFWSTLSLFWKHPSTGCHFPLHPLPLSLMLPFHRAFPGVLPSTDEQDGEGLE